jgi:predicted metal-dependent phosphoesterase TrpH
MDRLSLRIDLHVHTEFSRDALNPIKDVNERCREVSIDGYAVCDHDTIEGLDEAKALAGELVVLPGLEISARGAHILCLDPSELVPHRLSITETVEKIHAQGSLAILAHPYALPRSFVSLKEVEVAGFDAIEVANAAQVPFSVIEKWNRGLAEKLGLPQTGGSDSHIPETVGYSYTVVESATREVDDVIDAIRKGRTTPQGSGTGVRDRLVKVWRVLRKM